MRFPRHGATRTRGMFRTLDQPERVRLRIAKFTPRKHDNTDHSAQTSHMSQRR